MPFPSHPVPGPGGGEAANSAPIRSRPFRGPPASDPPADRVGGTFQALSAPVQGGRALPPPQHPHSLHPCPPARRAGTGQPAPAHRVSANRSRAARAKGCSGRCLGAAALPDPRCHAPAGCPGRCVSAGEGTCAGAEDEGARARAPAHRPALPSPRPARSPRPRGTRLRRRRSSSCSWSSDRGGGGCARGASAPIGGGGGGGGSSGTAAAPAAMSCAEVMYHPQPYGAPQCLPNPVAAATCPTACYHPSPQPGQQGDIGSVVDEHFSRALGQASTLHPESAITKSKMGLTPLWRGLQHQDKSKESPWY
ncbi:transcription cofactor vestigial-like protein 3 isoform X4 [Pipistrellus kuhlii]|uniref:transcription cofactor vestigial-like protein 3 isoform X4 n=1 Tax=Pipistrellus kuhlii TaxID=59472 RepID=UPI001E274954|nr:transcription cofactor vestigial-like protein 3 isoform X4 [Pipistrellus kuhlii]